MFHHSKNPHVQGVTTVIAVHGPGGLSVSIKICPVWWEQSQLFQLFIWKYMQKKTCISEHAFWRLFSHMVLRTLKNNAKKWCIVCIHSPNFGYFKDFHWLIMPKKSVREEAFLKALGPHVHCLERPAHFLSWVTVPLFFLQFCLKRQALRPFSCLLFTARIRQRAWWRPVFIFRNAMWCASEVNLH